MAPAMRLVLAFVAINAFDGAACLILLPDSTIAGFFWEVTRSSAPPSWTRCTSLPAYPSPMRRFSASESRRAPWRR